MSLSKSGYKYLNWSYEYVLMTMVTTVTLHIALRLMDKILHYPL